LEQKASRLLRGAAVHHLRRTIYLNALPYLFRVDTIWQVAILYKRLRSLHRRGRAHHATLLFGSFFFALPVLGLVFLDRENGERILDASICDPNHLDRGRSGSSGLPSFFLPSGLP